MLLEGKDEAGEFYRQTFADSFRYATHRIPEISDELYRIDQAITSGFGWQMGLFETWDAVGVPTMLAIMEKLDKKPAPWVYEMLEAGNETFYKVEKGRKQYYDIPTKSYKEFPARTTSSS